MGSIALDYSECGLVQHVLPCLGLLLVDFYLCLSILSLLLLLNAY